MFYVKNPLKRKVSHKTKPHINTARFFPYDNQNTFIKSFDTIISVYSLKHFQVTIQQPKSLPIVRFRLIVYNLKPLRHVVEIGFPTMTKAKDLPSRSIGYASRGTSRDETTSLPTQSRGITIP